MRETDDDRDRPPWTAAYPIAMAAMLAMSAATARAEDRPAAAGVDFFEARVRPVLVAHCYKCHSAGARAPKGGLRLDTPDGIMKGGDTGPAVVPGDVEASLLIRAIRYDGDETQMPPKGKLPDAAIAALEGWVKAGAIMPREVQAKTGRPAGIDFEAARSHWAYRPIRRVAPPRWSTTLGRRRRSIGSSSPGSRPTG